ncbi:MAG: BglII/BstYI family type II restriction endonuclease [Gammaproteobacteria bacterium]|nr:BglII/BstYI family type II restriction endonuclease [Gammaproteobacteria bacterium]
MNLQELKRRGYDMEARNHALAVLENDFPEPLNELCQTLLEFRIADVELVYGGGGEADSTQRLRRALTRLDWHKRKIVVSKIVDGEERSAISHEIDHVRKDEKGSVALEIEWNNKDPFFDRDLENFHRLHSEGVISVGVIVTRGKSLQKSLQRIISQCAENYDIRAIDDLNTFGLHPTPRQRDKIESGKGDFVTRWSRAFVQDKFGTATTHWEKLLERINRGVGNPCPLLLIGIPESSIFQQKEVS